MSEKLLSLQDRLTIAGLLYISGGCALVYQISWLRELRLVFGASTYASAAVLSIFMAGLGAGGAVLGRFAEKNLRPLRLYGWLELGIAAGALATPFLLLLVRRVYLLTGGSEALGQPTALTVRMVLAVMVLGLPTFLMGGTLPAAARAVTSTNSRRNLSLLYGVNTLGAVCGALLATFLLIELFGTRQTIIFTSIINAAVGLIALHVSRALGSANSSLRNDSCSTEACAGEILLSPGGGTEMREVSRRRYASAAACILGFVFFLMEIVWYRMLAPLLGGTTYTFGMILAVALFGIGAGGLVLFLRRSSAATSLRLFAVTCALEALGVALAYGLGDRIAVLAVMLKPLEGAGLAAQIPGWLAICGLVVLPAALVSGFQFPLLIGLLGSGKQGVARHTGAVYAWNTAGAIAGAVAGGFGLLPALGALGCWRLAVSLLLLLCALAMVLSGSNSAEGHRGYLAIPAALGIIALSLLFSVGPTAAWRHSQVAAHAPEGVGTRVNEIRNWLSEQRFAILEEWEGIESSVGLNRRDGYAFVVNGKVDGNARRDAGTQIMASLIGAALHPAPRKGMVIGLGTGTSAGWLAAVPTIERVDVAELEPAILEVARRCAPVNRGVMSNEKVRIIPGDGRELLMTSRERYDVIMSEPSNPYRAGIASLYTREFYQAAAGRLNPGGIFSQWVQAYDVDQKTILLIRATLSSVFADVQAWQTNPGDLLFTCSLERPVLSVPRLRARLAAEPFRSALLAAWGVTGLEGFLGSYVADDVFVRAGTAQGPLNTDDRMLAEFGFARGYAKNGFVMGEIRAASQAAGADRPAVRDGDVDWGKVEYERMLAAVWQGGVNWGPTTGSETEKAYRAYTAADFDTVVRIWREGWWKITEPLETLMLAMALANSGDEQSRPLIDQVRETWPAAAAAIEARLLLRTGSPERAAQSLVVAFQGFRDGPWNPLLVMSGAVALAQDLGTTTPGLAPGIFALLEQPFSVRMLDAVRIGSLLLIARDLDPTFGVRAIAQMEPNVYWRERFLRFRLDCYERTGNPLAGLARRDLDAFLGAQ